MNAPVNIYPWLLEHWAFFCQRLALDKLAHALMLQGPAGSGKSALAEAMVGRLLCAQDGMEDQAGACGQCRSCKLLAGGAHPDRFDIQPAEDSQVIKVDQIRDLIASLNLTTTISARKVAYIHPAESLTTAAANALLKSLEEPVGNAVLVLVCNDPGSLPVTIRSRCQAVLIHQPDTQVALDWLVQQSAESSDVAVAALQAGGGSPLRAAHFLASPEQDSFAQIQKGLAKLIARPGSVSLIGVELSKLNSDNLWRWLSLCSADAARSVMTGTRLTWLPADAVIKDKALLQLQRRADLNRQISSSPVREDLLLQDWLIRWAEQNT